MSEKPQTHIYPGISGVNYYFKGWRLLVNVKKEWPQEPDLVDRATPGEPELEWNHRQGSNEPVGKCTNPAPAALLRRIHWA